MGSKLLIEEFNTKISIVFTCITALGESTKTMAKVKFIISQVVTLRERGKLHFREEICLHVFLSYRFTWEECKFII